MTTVYRCDRCGNENEAGEGVEVRVTDRTTTFSKVYSVHFCQACWTHVTGNLPVLKGGGS